MAMAKLFNTLLIHQANFILDIQNIFGEDNEFLRKVSRFCDTSYAISILFPVFSSLDTKLGLQVLLVSSFTEWANTLLKWLLAEGRPYWWVREAKVHVPIRQTDVTCETGPGSPSGHVMGTAALGYVILHWLTLWFNSNIPQEKKFIRRFFISLLWSVYVSVILLVSLSRVNLAAHFPHQCLLGSLIGVSLSAYLIKEEKWALWRSISSMSKSMSFFLALVLSLISISAFAAHQMLGMDPGWSIKLAFKWCERPNYVSVYTTPVYSLVRDCGCFLAIGLASPVKERKFYPIIGATVTTLFFVAAKMFRPILPANDPFQFYMFHLLDNMLTALTLLTAVPYIASLVRFKEKTK